MVVREKRVGSETGSRMKEYLEHAHDCYAGAQKTIMSALDYVPTKKDEMVIVGSSIYQMIIRADENVKGMKKLAGDVLGDDVEAVRSRHAHIWSKVSELPSEQDKLRFIISTGELLKPVTEVLHLLDAMQKKRREYSNMRRYN